MTQLAVLIDSDTFLVDGSVDNGRAMVAPADLTATLGWELKPEGLCRGDVCVPVRGPSLVEPDGRLDLAGAARLVDRDVVVADEGVVAISVERSRRHQALRDRMAPNFELPDLNGNLHSLEEFAGRRRLLFAFSSW